VRTATLDAVALLARRLNAANPDAKHPGKAKDRTQGQARFPLGFSVAFWGQKPSSFP